MTAKAALDRHYCEAFRYANRPWKVCGFRETTSRLTVDRRRFPFLKSAQPEKGEIVRIKNLRREWGLAACCSTVSTRFRGQLRRTLRSIGSTGLQFASRVFLSITQAEAKEVTTRIVRVFSKLNKNQKKNWISRVLNRHHQCCSRERCSKMASSV